MPGEGLEHTSLLRAEDFKSSNNYITLNHMTIFSRYAQISANLHGYFYTTKNSGLNKKAPDVKAGATVEKSYFKIFSGEGCVRLSCLAISAQNLSIESTRAADCVMVREFSLMINSFWFTPHFSK